MVKGSDGRQSSTPCTRWLPAPRPPDVGERWILAIDHGNGGPKVAVCSLDGEVRRTAMRTVHVHVGLDGAATQDAVEWWIALREAAREAIDGRRRRPRGAARGRDHRAVRPRRCPSAPTASPSARSLLWADTRARDLAREVIGGRLTIAGFAPHKVLPFVRLTGGSAGSPSGADPTGHSLLLRSGCPRSTPGPR